MIVIASLTNWRKSGISIHCDGLISVTHFKMNAGYPIVSGVFHKIVEQPAADAPATAIGRNGEEQQFRFVGYGAKQAEADSIGAAFTSKHERHSAHGEDPGELRARPRFAVAAPERGVHHAHYRVEVFG